MPIPPAIHGRRATPSRRQPPSRRSRARLPPRQPGREPPAQTPKPTPRRPTSMPGAPPFAACVRVVLTRALEITGDRSETDCPCVTVWGSRRGTAIAESAHGPVTVARLRVAMTLVDNRPGQLHVKVWVHAARIPVACLDRIGVLASRPARRRAPLSPASGFWSRREIARRTPLPVRSGRHPACKDWWDRRCESGHGRGSSADHSNNSGEAMNPQLLYVTTQQRIAEQRQLR